MGKRQRRRERLHLEEHAGPTAAELRTDPVTLTETAVRADGTIRVKLISPGWGTRGYYSAELLERDGPTAFPRGTHMYFDHPTATEAVDRPERSLRDLAAVLETDARWEANGPDGPGLYAEATVFDAYRAVVDELAPHIGVSIRAQGFGHHGEAEGRHGQIVDELVRGLSVDFVTHAGRGGRLLQLLESARDQFRPGERAFVEARNVGDWMASRIHLAFTQHADDMFGNGRLTRQERIALSSAIGAALDAFNDSAAEAAPQLFSRDLWDEPTTTTTQEGDMPLSKEDLESIGQTVGTAVATAVAEAIKPLTEANQPPGDQTVTESDTVAKLREDILIRDARDHARGLLAENGALHDLAAPLPTVACDRLIEAAARAATFAADGQTLDKTKLEEALKAAVTERAEEIAEATGAGTVTGVGNTKPDELYEADDFDTKFEESLRKDLGLPAKTAS